jgi:hypothetical protein
LSTVVSGTSIEGYREASRPKANSAYWNFKLSRKAERDVKHTDSLRRHGFEVITVLECHIEQDREPSARALRDQRNGKRLYPIMDEERRVAAKLLDKHLDAAVRSARAQGFCEVNGVAETPSPREPE